MIKMLSVENVKNVMASAGSKAIAAFKEGIQWGGRAVTYLWEKGCLLVKKIGEFALPKIQAAGRFLLNYMKLAGDYIWKHPSVVVIPAAIALSMASVYFLWRHFSQGDMPVQESLPV